VNQGWRYQKLSELCEFKNGLWKGKKPPYLHVGVIRNTNFTKDGKLNDKDIAYLDVEEKQYASRKLVHGDLILEKSGGGPKQPVGRIVAFDKKAGEFSFSNFTSVVRIKDSTTLYFRYLHWYLHYLYLIGATESMQKHSTNIRNLQLAQYKSVDVPLPSLSDQKRIVAILDEAFAGIETAVANSEKNLASATDLFNSYLKTRLANVASAPTIQSLSDVAELIVDCEHKTAPTQEAGFPSIRTPNIGKGVLLLDNVKRVSPEVYRLWTRRAEPRSGDLILAREAPAGNVGVIPDGQKVCLGQRTVLIRPRKSLANSHFLAYLLLHPLIQSRLLEKSTGATVQHINMRDIRALKLGPLPSLDKQLSDTESIEYVQKQARNVERHFQMKLAKLIELKQSLLQKAFSGELTGARAEREVETASA
jgi:type I restriction enzyme, S subunit